MVDNDYRGGEVDDGEGGGSNRHHRGSRYLSDSGAHHAGGSVWPKPARVLAFALKDDTEVAKAMVTVVQLDADGEVVDSLNLPGLLHSARSQREESRKRRVSTSTDPAMQCFGFYVKCKADCVLVFFSRKTTCVDCLSFWGRMSHRPL